MRLSATFLKARLRTSPQTNLWSREALRELRKLAELGLPVELIAAKLGRTPSAIRNKAGLQGISLKHSTRGGKLSAHSAVHGLLGGT